MTIFLSIQCIHTVNTGAGADGGKAYPINSADGKQDKNEKETNFAG